MTMFKLLDKSEWDLSHREPRQTYKDYFDRVGKLESHFKLGEESLQNSEGATKAQLMELTRLLAWMSNDYLIYSYSAGVPLSVLAEFTPTAIDYWECFSRYDLDFDNSPESDSHRVPHIDLYDRDYWFALQLVSFAILLGHPELLHNIMTLLIYENDDQDALLEAMVAPWLHGRPGSAIYTRELPYRKTRKIFAAKPEKRAELMAQYLDEWYAASRREPYYDRHKSSRFPGYWALEAGVITFILDIDDSAYREKPFYPRDLVDYARQYAPKPGCISVNDGDKHDQRRPNVPANHPCPESGWWFTPAKTGSRRYFKAGETMPSVGGDYGDTFWQWSPDQSARLCCTNRVYKLHE